MDIHLLFIFSIILLYHLPQPSYGQQPYSNVTPLNCNETTALSKGYACNHPQKICQSFVIFRSTPSYDSPVTVAPILGSDARSITLINNFSSTAKIPTNQSIVVPVTCSCSGNIFQHYGTYVVKSGDTYYLIARDVFQGLTSCDALIGQNYYYPADIPFYAELTVPIRCACPSENQTASGVTSLLVYMVAAGDSIQSIGETFGVSNETILEANMVSENDTIYPLTPLLIPLNSKTCAENPESFHCYCPNGYLVSGSEEGGLHCIPQSNKISTRLAVLLGVGIGIGLLCVILSVYYLYRLLKKRRVRLAREKLFKQNGGVLLEQQLSLYGSSEKSKIFTVEEMQRATDNYNRSRLLGQGGYGMVYKGMLRDGNIVAVKRSKEVDKSQIQQFINEVVILSQINHRNIVKLLGCCLETEFPLLVYEYVANGTLSEHIHGIDEECKLAWEHRLKIACEVAAALSYMHSAASLPIFHRDIKSSNILLDDKYSAKVSDFGTSRLIPFDKTHFTTGVQGTFGYVDPEYFQTGQFSDKSDVYSFGVVLVELLTGKKAVSFYRVEEERNLVTYFMSLMKDNEGLTPILDPRIANDGRRRENIEGVANLAMRCLRLNGKKRPMMKEVATELEGLFKSEKSLQVENDVHEEFPHSTTDAVAEESMEDSILFSLEMEASSSV